MPAGASRKSAEGAAPSESSIPPSFVQIRPILDEVVSPGELVNVIGVVKDCRLPIPTNGNADHKCTITLYDLSTDEDNHDINFVVFRPEADMPRVTAGDVVVATNVKVQRYRGDLSLITNRTTSIRVYTASKIPPRPQSAKIALAPASKRDTHVPTVAETAYVSHIYHKIDKYSLPGEHEFQARAEQSLNVKQKFSLLKDVQEGKFCDLIVQVVRDPYDGLSALTLYVSDYTENPRFHPRAWEGLSDSGLGGGDPYGYTTGVADVPNKEWVGPYGRMSLQITCFEPHATFIREEVKAGQWVGLRNVQIKYGRDGRFLEGFLREERGSSSRRVNVDILDLANADTIDPNLKEAIRRCRDYHKKKRQQIKEIKAAEAAGMKRKASLSFVVPFVCAKYRAVVRVVDFFPPSLEDFACSRKQTVYDILSDNEADSDCVSSTSDEGGAVDGDRIWEWRFALQLEDPAPSGHTKQAERPPRIWVLVDNIEAQCLTGLDATDLRQDPETLEKLRERMSMLWGNLEEHKAQTAEKRRTEKGAENVGQNRFRHHLHLQKPPLQSSSAEDNEGEGIEGFVSNRPFACCIKQYGVQGEGGAWVRCFGLFGTKILVTGP
ncbi:uncharacterized protein P884DRAFT_196452 [Thermothelomyces heterothallicus CBS 202.75]|uniref:uncharacterized protein n=1 Tax=Thermothelomyces heterothallicus CBS 202.75 TaxID=1149848 RepID=UPI00374227F2